MPPRDDEPMAGRAGTAPSWDASSDQGSQRHPYEDQEGNEADSWPGQASHADQATKPMSGSGSQQDWRANRASHGLLARLVRGPGSRLPLRREREGRLVGGVMAGLSTKTGVDVTALRVGLVVITLLSSGLAAAAYVVAWLLLPFAGDSANIASRAVADRRGIGIVALIASMLGVLLVVASVLDAGWLNAVAWPIIISVCGMVLIWRNADPEEQAALHRVAGPVFAPTAPGAKERFWLRVLITVVLLATGLYTLLHFTVLHGHHQADLLPPLGGLLLILAGTVVAFGPWWLRVARDLAAERQARIRAEERADMAARVHDSVLQTLALIQRRATEPQQVVQLARSQERELRAWLFDDQAPGTIKGKGVTLAAGIRKIQQDVESQHRIAVDAVTVGDCDLDEDLEATLAAAREATVNAAKWSGSDTVSLFAEVEPESVSIFVRDRGRGFDPEAVSADRRGLAESVRARMARRGGLATIRSTPGEGTEVTLTMPRSSAADQMPRRT